MQFKLTRFISEQWNPVPDVVKTDLEGKTVIVTGANNGIGFEVAKHFALMNPGRCISEEGSRQFIWAAIGGHDNQDELRGAYTSLAQVCEPSDYVLEGKDIRDRLWDNLLDELIKIDSKVQDISEAHLK